MFKPLKFIFYSIFAVSTLLAVGIAYAGVDNEVPSCYTANKIKPVTPVYDNLVYVLLDQTVQLDAVLQKSVLDNILQMMIPGTKFVVTEFSAFSQGHYLTVLHTGIIEKPIPPNQEGDVVMSRLDSFKTCLKQQGLFAQRMVLGTSYQVMKESLNSLDQSDVMLAFYTVSKAVKLDSAKQKIVLSVTDGLENSSITTFYSHNMVRDINPDDELKKVNSNQLFGDFGGASVYVIGGAIMPPAKQGTAAQRNGYRDPKTLRNLKTFWQEYFQKSNAQLREFGEPALVDPVKFSK